MPSDINKPGTARNITALLVLLLLAALVVAAGDQLLPAGVNNTLITIVLLICAILPAYRLLQNTDDRKILSPDIHAPGHPTRNLALREPPETDTTHASHEGQALQILFDVVSNINSANGLDDLLTRFLYTLKRVMHAHGATIWIMTDLQQPELAASSGIDEALLLPDRQDFRRSLYERAATEGKVWIDLDLTKYEKIAGRKLFDQDGIGLVSVPMRYRGKITGVINLFIDTARLDDIDESKPLLTRVAHHISVAIEKSNNEERNRQSLVKEERTRIAHELHDSLAQSLASLRLQVRVLDETLHQGDESTTWQQLERIEHSLDEANTELRELIGNFRAPTHSRSLVDAIEQIVNRFRNETQIRTYLQKDCKSGSFNRDTEIQILRIIQEALWNIRKHSEAKTVRILLRSYGDHCHVLIEDDGVGINKQVYGSPGEHVGLTIMRERASRIGGNLRIESEPGEGTQVILEFDQPPASESSR